MRPRRKHERLNQQGVDPFDVSGRVFRQSPFCKQSLVKDQGMSLQLSRMLKQAGQEAPEVKPVLEVNPEHPLIKKLDDAKAAMHFHDLAHIVFDQALLAEGGLPEDPAAYVKRVNALLV